MAAFLEDALKLAPRWLIGLLVVGGIGLGIWNQNNEARFYSFQTQITALQTQMIALDKERLASVQDFVEYRQAVSQRLNELAAVLATKVDTATRLEMLATINGRLDRIDRHLEATDERLERLMSLVAGRAGYPLEIPPRMPP